MTKSCRSSSPNGVPAKRVQGSAKTAATDKASQDIPKTSCSRKGSFKAERKDAKSRQFFLWRLKSLVPGVSAEDKLSELEVVEETIAYIQFLQGQVQVGEDGPAVLIELLQSLDVSS